jgi:hypothetical protein
VARRPWLAPAVLFSLLMAVYLIDGGFLPVRDAAPNLCLPVQLLKRGSLSFSPREAPFMFSWTLNAGLRPKRAHVDAWDTLVNGKRADEWLAAGQLTDPQPRYYIVPSTREGRFIGIYGPGAGLSAVPYFALLAVVYRGWSDNMAVLGKEAKVFASACIAGSAVAVYFTFLLFVARPLAFVAGLVYGLGTCVWPELTQALWQQTPVLLFVSLGAYFLARSTERRSFASLAGLFTGAAVLCRPTLGILLMASGAYLLWKSRRDVLPFVLGSAVPMIALLSFNAYYLGSPFRMGQTEAARKVALSVTGSEDVWSTPLWEGAAGILVSPSRGLFVFSPFLAFAVWGVVEAWRRPGWEVFRVWSLTIAGLLLIASKWVMWFGGWVYGYRLIAEVAPLLVLFLIPVANRIPESKPLRMGFAALAALSIAIQALGTFRYDPVAWHGRKGYELQVWGERGTRVIEDEQEAIDLLKSGKAVPVKEVVMDIGQPRFRGRLWSISGGQLAWLLKSGAGEEARMSRKELMDGAVDEKMGLPSP